MEPGEPFERPCAAWRRGKARAPDGAAVGSKVFSQAPKAILRRTQETPSTSLSALGRHVRCTSVADIGSSRTGRGKNLPAADFPVMSARSGFRPGASSSAASGSPISDAARGLRSRRP